MPNNLISQVAILTNLITKVNDVYPGSSYAGPTNQAYYGSQVGARFALGNDEPRLPSALSGGLFQYVNLYTSMTATPKVGLITFWQTDTSYVATCDEPTAVLTWRASSSPPPPRGTTASSRSMARSRCNSAPRSLRPRLPRPETSSLRLSRVQGPMSRPPISSLMQLP